MQRVALSGVVLVVTPQDVAHLDAKRVLDLCRRSGAPVLGAVENMAGLVCPDCGKRIDVFPRVPHARSVWAQGVERLGSVPLDPEVAASGDEGRPLLLSHPASPQAGAFRELGRRLAG